VVGDQTIDKELVVGEGFLRVSDKRPGWDWEDALMHPWEPAFPPDSPVRSIEIDYPDRPLNISGINWLLLYWFIVSMVAALCFAGC
jgi:hypothetical protein